MPISPTDRALLEHTANHNELCGGCPLESLLTDDSPYWLMHCAAEGRPPPDGGKIMSQIERLTTQGYLTAADDPVVWALAFDEPSRGVLLTEKGKVAVDSYGERFGSEEEEDRAIEFVTAYVDESAKALPFRTILPAYLPERFGLLPGVEVDESSNRVYLKYYGGEDHIILAQGSKEQGPNVTSESRQVRTIPVAVTEKQETSLWVSMTFDWVFSSVYHRVSFNWLHQLSSSRLQREPVWLTDEMRDEAWNLVESVITEAESSN